MNVSEKGISRFENFAVIFETCSFDIDWNIHNSTVENGFKCAEFKLSVIKQVLFGVYLTVK